MPISQVDTKIIPFFRRHWWWITPPILFCAKEVHSYQRENLPLLAGDGGNDTLFRKIDHQEL
jgi:hypothetical protein